MVAENIMLMAGDIHHLTEISLHFNRRLFVTTDTELSAIAAPAIIGLSKNPLIGYSAPAATGIAMTL